MSLNLFFKPPISGPISTPLDTDQWHHCKPRILPVLSRSQLNVRVIVSCFFSRLERSVQHSNAMYDSSSGHCPKRAYSALFKMNNNGSYIPSTLTAHTANATNMSYTGNGTTNNIARTATTSPSAAHNRGVRLDAGISPLGQMILMIFFTVL